MDALVIVASLVEVTEGATVGTPVTRRPPGSRAGLLPPSPLRTTWASFPACCSSLANARLRTRFYHGQSLAVDLGVAPPKFFDVSLPACHGLRTPADRPLLACAERLGLPSRCGKTLGGRDSHFEAVPALQETRFSLRPTGFTVYASSILFAVSALTTPPWTQDSLRVGGSPFPNKDFHLARDAKLCLARQRQR
jgi:hypothetical protein